MEHAERKDIKHKNLVACFSAHTNVERETFLNILCRNGREQYSPIG